MSSNMTSQMVEVLVENYVTDGNALTGAATLRNFAAEDIDLLIDDDEVSSSILAAGSKTYLAGALFGMKTAVQAMTDETPELDVQEVVAANGVAIDESLARGVQGIKAETMQKLLDEVDG